VHAIADLYTTAMDALVIEEFVLVKQPSPAESPEHGATGAMVQP